MNTRIRWITSELGTCAANALDHNTDLSILDVRDLVDKGGNTTKSVLEKISQGVEFIQTGNKTVICCDYGMSRSNAIAVGVLCRVENISFAMALERVVAETGEKDIKLELLNVVKQAILSNGNEQKSVDDSSIIITGGNGYLGNKLVDSLSKTMNVVSPARLDLDIAKGPTELYLLALQKRANIIMHLANPRVFSSNIAIGESLTMLKNVIDVCIANNLTLVYPSSFAIYSGYAGEVSASELTPVRAKGPYGEAKILAEELIKIHVETNSLKCITLRLPTVYGHSRSKPRFIGNFIEKALHSETIVTHEYNHGDAKIDLIHIDDLASLITKMVTKHSCGTYNIGSGILTSTNQIAKLIIKKLGSNSTLHKMRIDTDSANILLDASQAKHDYGWVPITPLESGIEKLLDRAVQ